MIELYLKNYTEKEIKDMLVFYESDTGKSIVKKMPSVIQDSILIAQSMVNDFIPKMQALSQELKEEIEAVRKENE